MKNAARSSSPASRAVLPDALAGRPSRRPLLPCACLKSFTSGKNVTNFVNPYNNEFNSASNWIFHDADSRGVYFSDNVRVGVGGKWLREKTFQRSRPVSCSITINVAATNELSPKPLFTAAAARYGFLSAKDAPKCGSCGNAAYLVLSHI